MKTRIRRASLALNLAFALTVIAGCTPDASTPSPLTSTAVDERALTVVATGVDATARAVSALTKGTAPVLRPGSPLALDIANWLDTARDGVNAAQAARTNAEYVAALAKVNEAMTQVRTLILKIGA